MMLQRITWARLPVCGPMTVFWGMPNGQRDSASFLVVAGGQHPDVNHVRRDDRALRNVDVKWHSDIVGRSNPVTPRRPPRPCGTIWPAQLPFSWTEPPDPGASLRKKSSP